VVFPCALLCDAATGRLAIYYGAADTCTGLAFSTVDELVAFAKKDSLV
jgi:beta-1,4-mannooligosaccharide/beta-1,4-mannosyl-N-acetylglucosamine phosphorylase